MIIQPTQNIRQNFGAIRVKGVSVGSKQAKIMEDIALKYNKTADFGENAFGRIDRYIQTMSGSDKERDIMNELIQTLHGDKPIRIELFDDTKADKNVRKFSQNGSIIEKLFNLKK